MYEAMRSSLFSLAACFAMKWNYPSCSVRPGHHDSSGLPAYPSMSKGEMSK